MEGEWGLTCDIAILAPHFSSTRDFALQTSIHFVLVDGQCRNVRRCCGVGRESQCLTPSFFNSATRRLRTDPETATLVAHTIELYKAA